MTEYEDHPLPTPPPISSICTPQNIGCQCTNIPVIKAYQSSCNLGNIFMERNARNFCNNIISINSIDSHFVLIAKTSVSQKNVPHSQQKKNLKHDLNSPSGTRRLIKNQHPQTSRPHTSDGSHMITQMVILFICLIKTHKHIRALGGVKEQTKEIKGIFSLYVEKGNVRKVLPPPKNFTGRLRTPRNQVQHNTDCLQNRA